MKSQESEWKQLYLQFSRHFMDFEDAVMQYIDYPGLWGTYKFKRLCVTPKK